MTTPEQKARILAELVPALDALCDDCPYWGSITLQAVLHNGQVVRVASGREATRQATAAFPQGELR